MWIWQRAKIWKFLPVVLLVFALISTVWIYIYNWILEWQNNKLDLNISWIDAKIKNVEKDPNLQIFNLLTNNKKTIERFESHSQITTFINRMELIEGKYQVIFEWFSYSNGVISTLMTNSPDSSIIAYKVISDFIKWYRTDKKAYFTLPFIWRVSGSKTMQMNVKFNVKEILPNETSVDSQVWSQKKKDILKKK